MVNSPDTLAVVLAIGSDTHLLPLTRGRAGPALPFAGNFRIIDFVLSNCVNSGVRRVLVLSQYRSHSLHKHLRDGWSIFNPELGEFVTPVAPQMRERSAGYRGPVDALQQVAYLLERNRAENVLVLAGDAIYRMDYAAMLRAHIEQGAEITVACRATAQTAERAADGADALVADSHAYDAQGAESGSDGPVPASIGATAFEKTALLGILAEATGGSVDGNDLDAQLLPQLLGRRTIHRYLFGGVAGRVSQDRYWCRPRDLDEYYRANLRLLESEPPIDLYQRDWPLRTYQAQAPPPRMAPGTSNTEGICVNSIIAAGSVIAGGGVDHSILFPGVRIGDGAIVADSILFAGVEVGAGAELRRCIVEKHVAVPAGARVGIDPRVDAEHFTVTADGVAVVTSAAQFRNRQG
jgi:glucose-1-phosphate adenylyltransferase